MFVGVRLVWGVFFLGCSGEKDVQIQTVEDIREAPKQTDQGWSLGGVQPCEDPKPMVSYTDSTDIIADIQGTNTVNPIEGAIGLQFYDDDWWIWQVGMQNPFAWSLHGERIEIDASHIVTRLYVLDINDDGEDDLLLLGQMLEVVWSVLTPHQHNELLIPFDAHHGVRDAGLIDIDGDEDQDLWVLMSAGLDGDNWGLVFEQIDHGVFLEPVEMGSRTDFGASFDGVVLDWDNDTDPDLYVCNDFGPWYGGNHLLLNNDGELNHGDAMGADIETACMGASFADLDMDDRMDIYMTSASSQHFLKGTEAGFVEYEHIYQFPEVVLNQMLWGAEITDYNNDGLFDIVVATSGFAQDDPSNPGIPPYPLWMIEQQSDHTFVEVGAELGLEQESVSRAVLSQDINDDGIVDILVTGGTEVATVYLSDGCTADNWIEIFGPDNSIVRVFADNQLWTIHLTKTPGMGESKPASVHIGLGDIETIDWIKIDVPWMGRRSILGPIETRRAIYLSP